MHFCRGIAILVAVAALGLAQDNTQAWKTTENYPAVDLSGLNSAQKAEALKLIRERGCSCGCNMTVAQCRIVDPSCSYSTGLAKVLVDAVRQGKTEKQAMAAADASRYANVQPRKLLDDPITIPTAGAPVTGPQNAPVTLIEFSDFQCPYCAQATPNIEAILRRYPSQLKLIFKQFPLTDLHPQAELAALASVAAQRQGKFWQMHDALFASHRDLSRSHILELAQQNGLDMKQFQQDLDSAAVRQVVERDMKDGEQAGVEGTPTMFINGQKFNGSLEPAEFGPVLDAELKKVGANAATASVRKPAEAKP